ncbi:MAG: PfkB family carbohydrate kinase [Planctomycetota bacterium]
MIVTVTTNPCVHKLIVYRSSARVEKVVKPVVSSYQAGGKGLNVARAAARLGAKVLAVSTHGGTTGALFEEAVTADGFPARLVRVAAPTRLSTGLFDEDTGEFSEYLESGGAVTADEAETLFDVALAATAGASIVALCGSSPHARLDDLFVRLLERTAGRVPVVVDTYGPPARAVARSAPMLFKSNRDELVTSFGIERSEAALVRFARERLEHGTRYVLITGGADGALLFEPERILRFQGPRLVEKNPVGSGDAMFGGMLAALEAGAAMAAACQLGAAAGAANAARLGVCDFERAEVERLAAQVHSREVPWPR